MTKQMTTTRSAPFLTRTRLLLAAGCAGLVLAGGGCGPDADEQALTNASIRLSTVSLGSGTAAPEESARAAFNEVIAALQGIASGEGALAADAAVLVSEAQRGLGILLAEDVAELHQRAQLRHAPIRAQLRAWQMHSAAAEAAALYDPAPELAELDRETRARQDESERVSRRKSEIEGRIADLLAQVTDRMSQASELRAQAGELQMEIPRVSATEGLALTERIRELTRRADKLEMDARELKVQADRLNLDLRAAEVETEKLANQIELLAQSRSAVRTRATASEEQAARARGDAQRAAQRVAELVDSGENALTALMEGPVRSAAADATRQFETAAATGRRAMSARRSEAQLVVGQAQQSLGNTQWTHALGLDGYAQLLEELAQAEPALPASAEYASRAVAARRAAAEAKLAAYEAYDAAKSAYEGTGARGEAAERLEAVATRMNEILRSVGSGVVDAQTLEGLNRAEEDTTDEPAADDEQDWERDDADAAAGDGVAELRAAIADVLGAIEDGRWDEAEAFVIADDEVSQAMLDSVRPVLRASMRLDEVTEAQFGESFSDWQTANGMGMQGQGMAGMDLTQLGGVDVESLDVRVQGDEGVVLTGDPEMPQLNFRRDGGAWKLVLSTDALTGGAGIPAGADAEQLTAMMTSMMGAMSDVVTQAVDRVESGEVTSNEQLAQWMNSQMMQVMMRSMQGGG